MPVTQNSGSDVMDGKLLINYKKIVIAPNI
jgi:hypothetical protein